MLELRRPKRSRARRAALLTGLALLGLKDHDVLAGHAVAVPALAPGIHQRRGGQQQHQGNRRKQPARHGGWCHWAACREAGRVEWQVAYVSEAAAPRGGWQGGAQRQARVLRSERCGKLLLSPGCLTYWQTSPTARQPALLRRAVKEPPAAEQARGACVGASGVQLGIATPWLLGLSELAELCAGAPDAGSAAGMGLPLWERSAPAATGSQPAKVPLTLPNTAATIAIDTEQRYSGRLCRSRQAKSAKPSGGCTGNGGGNTQETATTSPSLPAQWIRIVNKLPTRCRELRKVGDGN